MYSSQKSNNSLHFSGRGPQITSKHFTQNPDGTFVLSYGLAHARLNMQHQAHNPVQLPQFPSNEQHIRWTNAKEYEKYSHMLASKGRASIRTLNNVSVGNKRLQKALNAPVMRCI